MKTPPQYTVPDQYRPVVLTYTPLVQQKQMQPTEQIPVAAEGFAEGTGDGTGAPAAAPAVAPSQPPVVQVDPAVLQKALAELPEFQKLVAVGDDISRLTAEQQATIEQERQAKAAAEQAAEAARLAEMKDIEEIKGYFKQQIAETQQALLSELNQVRSEAEAQRQRAEILEAEREKDRQLQEIASYRARVIAEAGDAVHPSLLTFVGGFSTEEIDASLEEARRASEQILREVQEAITPVTNATGYAAAMRPPAVPPTGNVAGPGPHDGGTRTLSPQEIRDMPLAEYAKVRGDARRWAAQQYHSQRG